jgi:hypothetical protein
MKILPNANNLHLVTQDLGSELLIYNTVSNKAYSLNETAKTVFIHCDGKHSFDYLKQKYRYTDDLLHLTLDELQRKDLIDYKNNHFGNLSRREIVKRVGLTSLIALPVVTGLLAPLSAQAASQASNIAACQPCQNNAQCASGSCVTDSNGNNVCTDAARGEPRGSDQSPAVSQGDCNDIVTAECCSASGTFTAPDRCICN